MKEGYLKINVYGDNIANPIKNASVLILKDDEVIYSQKTDENGQTNIISLKTVDKNYSEEEQYKVRPYEVYDVLVTAFGLRPRKINGVQIYDGVTSIQDIYLSSIDYGEGEQVSNIAANTLWEDNSPYVGLENEPASNYISPYILKEVVVPETIVVHDGIPSNQEAPNYTVNFTDYIKNVASSEIYSTWPKETIKANVLAIISFTLNRIYTEWYRSRGYDFTITSTTSYDQKYTRNGTIFENISNIVDEIFTNYIRSGIRLEPLLAHYKNNTSEEGYLSQWGSKELGDQGYDALQILRYYYGNSINIYEAMLSREYPYSFKSTLKEGDCSIDVYILQNSLNYIRSSYPGIPKINYSNGYFDSETKEALKTFQHIFSLPQTGEADFQTWYKISYILTAVENLNRSVFE